MGGREERGPSMTNCNTFNYVEMLDDDEKQKTCEMRIPNRSPVSPGNESTSTSRMKEALFKYTHKINNNNILISAYSYSETIYVIFNMLFEIINSYSY